MGMPDENVQRNLKTILDHFDKEDTAVRERQLRIWRRLKLFWEGYQRAWYSEVAHDWRIWDVVNEGMSGDTQQGYYDKPVNIFRAYLESIIAALSVTVPPIKCYPDDADNGLDLDTAKAGDKIAELIFRHNDVELLWLHALFIYCTEGMVACYSYPKSDESYGTYENKKYEDYDEPHLVTKCPLCESVLDDQVVDIANPPLKAPNEGYDDQFMPYENEDNPTDAPPELCPDCGGMMTPVSNQETFTVPRFVGTTKEAKSRVCLEAYGGLYVKVPNYARKQSDCPYLIYSYETHYAEAIERFAHLHGKKGLTREVIRGATGVTQPYEEWARLSPQYQGEYPNNTVTCRNVWLRPSAFNILGSQDDIDELKKLYPKGVKVVFVNDLFAEACPEVMDDCWTLTYNPLSDFVHFDPLGLLLTSIQEITNDLVSLTMQTIEHGIGQTFADPAVLNFDSYRQTEAIPGGIYEATPKSGKSISDAFYEVKTANLSPEVMPFAQNMQSMAQLVSGALPSLFGGAMSGGGETASQYSMSRAQALQRLQNTWKMLTSWWKQVFGKAIPMYIQMVQHDEREVSRGEDGNFVNILIRRAELEGKIGRVELEANENLPITWSQIKDTLMQLLQSNNPEILAVLAAPENLPIIREAIGLTDFYVPGEDDRNKQYDEIKLLLNSQPLPTMDPMMPEQSSVPIDPDYDNHEIEFEICRKWVVSEAGRQTKVDNPDGYKNVMLHGLAHKQAMMQAQMQQMMQQPPDAKGNGAAPPEKPTQSDLQEAPIMGDSNVQTVQ